MAAPIPEYDPTVALPEDTSAMPESVADAEAESGMIGLIAAGLVGLIPIGLAIAAVLWWRRRSTPVAAAPRPTAPLAAARTPEPPARPAAPQPYREPVFTRADVAHTPVTPLAAAGGTLGGVAVTERVRDDDVLYDEPEVPADDVRNRVSPQDDRMGFRPTASPVALPATAPTDPVERRNLIERMVSATPDKTNPFTSRKARAKRARLILASLGRDFGGARPAFG